MAIQKLTAMTSTDMTPLLTILQEHAVPKYFDSVTLEADGGYISCFCGETEFLRIYKYIGYKGYPTAEDKAGFLIKTSSGVEQVVAISYGTYYVGSVLVCSSCIVFMPSTGEQNFALLAKDSNGNTCFYALTSDAGNNWGNTSGLTSGASECKIWAISAADSKIRSYNGYLNNTDNINGKMLGMPISTYDHTMRDVYFPAVRQFTEITAPIVAEIDGVQHLVGRGFIALAE